MARQVTGPQFVAETYECAKQFAVLLTTHDPIEPQRASFINRRLDCDMTAGCHGMDDGLTKEEQIELSWAQHLAWRRPLTAGLREQLAEQQNWKCCYCGIRMDGIPGVDPAAPTFEHVVPRSKGGLDEIDNLAIACRRCNGERGSGP